MANNKETRTVQIIMDGKQPADTLKKLTNDIKILRAALNDSKIGSEAWESHAKKLKELNGEYTQLSSKVKHAGNSMQYLKEQMKAIAVGTIGGNLILAAGQALQNYFSTAVSYMADTSDQLADIRRVTGMTADEVDRLDNGLQNIQSRTATKDLRDIAIIAGKLGVAKDDIVGFTEATDKLNVALGGELGAIDQMTEKMGKIINAYKGAGEISEENILKIGNGIVELANSGVATGNYLIDFTRRLAGIAGTAELGLGDVMGLAAGFEEMGQNVEVSATAVTNILTKIGSDTAKFAKFAGMSAKDFADLINDKPIEALLALAKGLQNNKQGFADIAEAFADSEIGANRVVAVMGVLGKNTDFFRQKMAEGTAGVEHSGTILDAFALKNETLAAKIGNLGKMFKAFLQSDGLNKVLEKGVDIATAFMKAVTGLFNFLSKNAHIIQFVTTLLIAHVAWQYRSIVATRLKIVSEKAQILIYNAIAAAYLLLTGRIKATEIAQALLNRTMKATQTIANSINFATLIGAFVAVYNIISSVSKKYKEFREQVAQKVVSAKMDIKIEMDKQTLEENIKELEKYLKTNNKSEIEFGITLSKNSYDLAEEQVTNFQKSIEKKQKEIASLSEVKSTMGINYTDADTNKKNEARLNVLKAMLEKEKQQLEIANQSKEAYLQKKTQLEEKLSGIEQKAIDEKQKRNEENKRLDDEYLKNLEDFNQKLKKLRDDSRNAEIDVIRDEQDKELAELANVHKQRLSLEKQNYNELIKVAKKVGADTLNIDNTYKNLLLSLDEKYQKDRKAIQAKYRKEEKESQYKQELEDAEINKNALLKVYNELYLQEKINKEQHTHNIEDIELQHKITLLAIAKRYGKDYLDIERDIEQQRIKMLEDRIASQQRALQEEARTLTLVAQMQLDNATQRGFGVKKARKDLYEAENNELLTQLMTQEGMHELSERNIKTLRRKYREEFKKIDEQYADDERERRKAIADLTIDTFQQIFDAFMQFRQNMLQQEMNAMQIERDTELQNLENRKTNKLIYEDQYQLKKDALNKKYADKEKEIKRKQAIAEKRAALFSIALETAKNVVQAIPNWVLVGIVTAMGAVQMGLAAAQPIPYARGGKFLGDVMQGPSHANGGMPVLNPRTKQIVAELEGGEPILSQATYANNKELVDALLYNSMHKGGARLVPDIYSYEVPKMNYGGLIQNYYTTTYAKGGILPKNTSGGAIRQGRNPSTGEKMESLLEQQNILLQKMIERGQEPNIALFDYDYWEESQKRIAQSKNIANV
jgi:TP901 family phage tail tape measure protein